MKVLCDVHLSIRLVKFLAANGVEAIHANSLPQRSETLDAELTAFADTNGYVIFTKDEDFRTTYLLKSAPRKLVHIRTGNGLKDQALLELISRHLPEIKKLDACQTFYLEIDKERLTAIVVA